MPKCGVVTPCLNNIHQTVAAVASVTTDIEREMWNILEASSGAELGEVNYIFPDEDSAAPTPPPRRHRMSRGEREFCESPFSYHNSTYAPSPDDNDFEEVFLPSRHHEGGVDHNALSSSLIACALREQLRVDINERIPRTPDSQNDYKRKEDSKSATAKTKTSSQNYSPQLTPTPVQPSSFKENPKLIQISNSSDCLNNSSIFIVEAESNTLSPGNKPKFRTSTKSLNQNSTSFKRSCSCASSTSASPHLDFKCSLHSIHTNSASTSSNESNQHVSLSFDHQPNSNTSDINYYTFHHPPSLYHRNALHHDKFSPFKAVSNFIFPPIVKHSSLFHLFHASNSETSQTSNNDLKKRQTLDCYNSERHESNGPSISNVNFEPGSAEILQSTATPLEIRNDR